MQETVMVVMALGSGGLIAYAVAGAVANDGYGHRPTPRSHRDEVSLTQHEKLRQLAR